MSTQSDSYERFYTRELIESAQSGDKLAMEELVKKNSPLVNSLIKKYVYYNENESIDDLFQIGMIGLIKAIKNFDFSYNTKFSTYAVYIINGELKRHFRDDGIIKVSRGIKTTYLKAKAQRDLHIRTYGIEPTLSQIAEAIGASFEEVALAFEACQKPEYLSDFAVANPRSDNARRNEEVVEDKKNNIDDTIDLIALKNAISSLSSEYRQIITLRYFRGMTQNEVAKLIGLSQVQVSRLEKKVIDSLKKHML